MSSKSSRTIPAGLTRGSVFLAGVLAAALSAQAQATSVIDDFEAASNQNKFMGYSYFYADKADQGTSVVNSATVGPGVNELLFDPLKSVDAGYNGSKHSLKLDFTYGANKPQCLPAPCSYGQMVGFGTQLIAGTDAIGAGEGKTIDLTGATAITFFAKASTAMKVRVEITTSNITNFAFHRGEVLVTTAWAQHTVLLTPGLGGINQPSWNQVPVPFDPTKVQKLQFQISADDNATLTAGTLWLDDIKALGYNWVPAAACIPCVGTTPGTGGLLADLEPGTGATPRPAHQNYAGGYWYAYNDVGARVVTSQAQYSEIFEGVDLTNPTPSVPLLQVSPTKGNGGTGAAYIKFQLGPTFKEGVETIMPFVGLGTKVSDNLETIPYNATGSTNISFDYWTEAASTFKYIRLEAKSNQTDLGTNKGVVHHALFPATAGAWKTAIVPWNKLVLPDWDAVPNKTAPLKLSGLLQFQWAVQDAPGTSGAFAIDNVRLGGITIGVLRKAAKSTQGLRMTQVAGRLQVGFDLPAGVNAAQVTLTDLKGAVVASRSLTGTGAVQTGLDVGSLRSGLYSLQVRHGQVVRSTPVTLLK